MLFTYACATVDQNTCIGVSSWNLEECVNEHKDTTKFSALTRHLFSNPDHSLTWNVVSKLYAISSNEILTEVFTKFIYRIIDD